MGTANPPTIINPVLTSHSVSATIVSLAFNGLVRLDADGKVVPSLAKEWTVSEDGLEYTFYLYKNIKFHDGVELTARDVQFTYNVMLDDDNACPWKSDVEAIERVEIVNDYTVKFVLKERFPNMLHKLVREIIPEHLWRNAKLRQSELNYRPIGTGPFKFKEWNKDNNTIILTANKNYFEGRPYL
ncbi:MAG: hypothetical protein KC618_07660, partial [Candidatus Omnitrophica bacterium]|nr:hypothetical protein [Candidatus Omnitrophota bacterium]